MLSLNGLGKGEKLKLIEIFYIQKYLSKSHILVKMSRESWKSRWGFIMAATGSAIGLGNVWRFPYITYDSGGGAFFIPFLFALFTAGIPILIIELGIGGKTKRSPPLAFQKFFSKKKVGWVGWWAIIGAIFLASYYSVIIGWSISYIGLSPSLGWGKNPQSFFMNDFLGWTGNPLNLGGMNFGILAVLALTWVITGFIIIKGVTKGIEKCVKFVMPICWVLIMILIIRAVTLPGATDGLNWYLSPDFSKLSEGRVWINAYGQVFFSLSVGMGTMITYGSYMKGKGEIVNNSFIIAFADALFAFLSGLAVFGTLGFMASSIGVEITEVVQQGMELAFVTYPKAISMMPLGSGITGILFFSILLIAGLTSLISLVETASGSIMEAFNLSRKKATVIICLIDFGMGIIFATKGGFGWVNIIDLYVNYAGLIFIVLIEVILIGWIYNTKRLRIWVNYTSELTVGSWWDWSVKIFCPLFLIAGLAATIIDIIQSGYPKNNPYPNLAMIIGLTAFVVGMLIAYQLLQIQKVNTTMEKFED